MRNKFFDIYFAVGDTLPRTARRKLCSFGNHLSTWWSQRTMQEKQTRKDNVERNEAHRSKSKSRKKNIFHLKCYQILVFHCMNVQCTDLLRLSVNKNRNKRGKMKSRKSWTAFPWHMLNTSTLWSIEGHSAHYESGGNGLFNTLTPLRSFRWRWSVFKGCEILFCF